MLLFYIVHKVTLIEVACFSKINRQMFSDLIDYV